MNVNEILAQRFYKYFKYTRNIAIVSAIAFVILNAINTNNDILYWIIYVCLMAAMACSVEAVVLYILARKYEKKK